MIFISYLKGTKYLRNERLRNLSLQIGPRKLRELRNKRLQIFTFSEIAELKNEK